MSLQSKLRSLWRYRPRVLTVLLLFGAAAPVAMANFTAKVQAIPGRPRSLGVIYARGMYGWPVMWHWHNLGATMTLDVIVNWEYSGARLAANLVCWAIMLAVPAVACEWLLRRYRPRLRWSLRTMLAGVALAAAFCAWFAAARNRAHLQDPIIAKLIDPQCAGVERPGPKWLEFVVPDSFRRRIVAVDTRMYRQAKIDEAFVAQLGQLPQLAYLNLEVEQLTPAMAAALRNLRQLRWLYINEKQPSHQSLEAIGELTQLEGLYLCGPELASDSLPCFAGLTNLKTLTIENCYPAGAFSQMPALPRLEAIDVVFAALSGRDLRRLAILPTLKGVDLKYADFSADAKLTDLTRLPSLEELTVDGDDVSAEGLESLAALKHLKALHITERNVDASDVRATLNLDGRERLVVVESELDGFRRALHTLRRSHPGIIINGDAYANNRHFGREPPWEAIRYASYKLPPPWEGIESSSLRSTWLPARLSWALPVVAPPASGKTCDPAGGRIGQYGT
jgi:hypothetical protein